MRRTNPLSYIADLDVGQESNDFGGGQHFLGADGSKAQIDTLNLSSSNEQAIANRRFTDGTIGFTPDR